MNTKQDRSEWTVIVGTIGKGTAQGKGISTGGTGHKKKGFFLIGQVAIGLS